MAAVAIEVIVVVVVMLLVVLLVLVVVLLSLMLIWSVVAAVIKEVPVNVVVWDCQGVKGKCCRPRSSLLPEVIDRIHNSLAIRCPLHRRICRLSSLSNPR